MTWMREQATTMNLSDDEIARLAEAGYTEKQHFIHVTASELMADTGIKRPQANAILAAAGVLAAPKDAATIQFVLAKPGVANEVSDALDALGTIGKAAAIMQLRTFGIVSVVENTDGTVDKSATLDYLNFGAPAVAWWNDKRVVRVDQVGAPRLHHPRTGAVLSKGDPVDWHALERDKLIIAAAIYLSALDAGAGEWAVFADVKDGGPMASKAGARLQANAELRWMAEARIAGQSAPESEAVASRVPEKRPDRLRGGGSRTSAHTNFLQTYFASEELRRFVKCNTSFERSLPGPTASLAEVASRTVELAEQHGIACNAEYWRAMIAERPRRSAEICTVAAMYGVAL